MACTEWNINRSINAFVRNRFFFFFPRFPDGPDGLHELLKSRGRCSGSALQGLERGATIPKLPCFSLVSSELQDYNPEQGPGSLNWMFVVLFFLKHVWWGQMGTSEVIKWIASGEHWSPFSARKCCFCCSSLVGKPKKMRWRITLWVNLW